MSLLEVAGFRVAYGGVEAVRGVDFAVHAGEIVVLLGANGAGKSSTLKGVVGLAPVIAGQVRFQSQDIRPLSTELLARRRLTRVRWRITGPRGQACASILVMH